MGESPSGEEQLRDILQPHAHDVLSGRGNFVNFHVGNAKFRELVKEHKKAYVACPKSQKANFSTLIFDEIRALKPPGRFLKQNSTTKFWHAIGEKKALDKTRQALREGAPELLKELGTGGSDNGDYNEGSPDLVGPLEGSQRMHGFGASVGSFSVNSSDFQNITDSFTSAAGGGGSFPATGTTVAAVQMKRGSGDLEQLLSSGNVNTNALLAAAVQLQAAQQQIGSQVQVSNSVGFNPTPGGNVHSAGGVQHEIVLSQGRRNDKGRSFLNGANEHKGSIVGEGFNDINAFITSCHSSTGGIGRGINNNAFAQFTQQLAVNNFRNMSKGSPPAAFEADQEQRRFSCPSDAFEQCQPGRSVATAQDSSPAPASAIQLEEQDQASSSTYQNYQVEETIITTSIPLKTDGPSGVSSFNHNQFRHHLGICEPTPLILDTNSNACVGDKTNEQRRRPHRSMRGGGLNSSLTRRGGLSSSSTRRAMQTDITSSLMSIESLTLDDIQSDVVISGIPVGSMKHSDSLANMSMSLAEFDESDMSKIFEDESMGLSRKGPSAAPSASASSSSGKNSTILSQQDDSKKPDSLTNMSLGLAEFEESDMSEIFENESMGLLRKGPSAAPSVVASSSSMKNSTILSQQDDSKKPPPPPTEK